MKQILSYFSLLSLCIVFFACSDEPATEDIKTDIGEKYSEYIAGYSTGVLSKNDDIIIELAQSVDPNSLDWEDIKSELFEFSPSLEGEVILQDNNTIVFRPSEHLKSGQVYKLTFQLKALFEVEEGQELVEYEFRVKPQDFTLEVGSLQAMDPNVPELQTLNASIVFADIATFEEAQKVVKALNTDESDEYQIDWLTTQDNYKVYEFEINNIKRETQASQLFIKIDGSDIGIAERKAKRRVGIPAIGEFKLMSAKVINDGGMHLVLQFSDPVDPEQDLTGLITISGVANKRIEVSGNKINVYPQSRVSGSKTVSVFPGVKSKFGYKIQDKVVNKVIFSQIKPEIRMVGSGSILPSSQGLILPFEAVSLKAVNVRVKKVYQNNVKQFFQVNNHGGTRQFNRVGSVVLEKVVSLENQTNTDLNKWNRFTLKLDELINQDPGAIYNIEIGFKQHQALYDCESEFDDELEIDENSEAYWNNFDDYYHDYEGYHYERRDNPCDVSFYGGRKNIATTILASNIGLIGKKGENGDILIVATDIRTTEPLNGIEVQLYDYQQQLIQTASTNAEGIASFPKADKAFLAIATNNKEKGYLKLSDGNSLSLSNFDVGGEEVDKGIKGFIYGERGVWRPGDTLYFTFILEDKNKVIPKGQPVIFELRDPKGQTVDKQVVKHGGNGFYKFVTSTNEDAQTGRWNLKVKAGGRKFYKTVKIEAIKPNRLKVDLDFGKDYLSGTDKNNLNGEVKVAWMHGAKGSNLRAEYELVLKEATASFKGFGNYTFDNPSVDFYSEPQKVFTGRTDENGIAKFSSKFSLANKKPTKIRAVFNGKVYEPSGNFSIDYKSIDYYPYESMMGINVVSASKNNRYLETDTTHTVNIITVDPEGKRVPRAKAEVRLYKLDWRWWWDYSSGRSNYVNRYNRTFKSKETIDLVNGKGIYKLKIDYPKWGRYLLEVEDPVSGHISGKVIWIDWPYWRGQSNKGGSSGASMLSISTDKENYATGETVSLNIPSSEGGRAFVSLESGSRVLKTFWVETAKGNTKATFKIEEGMAPNIYAHVTLLQPHMQSKNDLPIRLYGVTRIAVDDPATRLKPLIKMPEVLEPEQQVEITVAEKDGKAMTYTVAVVDEGLLDLTNFKTPEPWDHFYAQEALGVKTFDIYDYVIGAFSGDLQKLLALGGDAAGKGKKKAKAKRFKPVVKYFGPFYLPAGAKKTHSFRMPNYIGSVRTMVVAGDNGAYGSAEQATPVKQSLMVLGTLPRFLSPGIEFDLPVTVFASDDKVKQAEITLNTDELIEVVGSNKQNITFEEPGEKTITYKVKVKAQLGISKVSVVGAGAGKTSRFEAEIDVRSPNPVISEVKSKLLNPGETWTEAISNMGIKGTNKVLFEASSLPSVNLEKRLEYLIQYPHGCIEQTTSGVFPQLFLSNVTKLNSEQKGRINENIEAGISRLYNFKQADGGLGYWPGAYESSAWGSVYAGHFLTEANKAGYYVESNFLNNLYDYLSKEAREFESIRSYSTMTQAYRLFVLALAGKPQYGAMNRLAERTDLNKTVLRRLAGAYALVGRTEMAKKLLNKEVPDREFTREWYWYTYGSDLRDQAMALETMIVMGEQESSFKLLQEVAQKLSANRWYSTQSTAFGLIAYSKYAAKYAKGSSAKITCNFDGSGKTEYASELPIIRKEFDPDKKDIHTFQFTNTGDAALYVKIYSGGKPIEVVQTSEFKKLNMTVMYKDMKGKQIQPDMIKQGSEFKVMYRITNPGLHGQYRNLAFTQMIPAGWEIRNTRVNEEVRGNKSVDYIDIRDDRVNAYFNLNRDKSIVLEFEMHASFVGDFFLPPAVCSEMYDDEIKAQVGGKPVTVYK